MSNETAFHKISNRKKKKRKQQFWMSFEEMIIQHLLNVCLITLIT